MHLTSEQALAEAQELFGEFAYTETEIQWPSRLIYVVGYFLPTVPQPLFVPCGKGNTWPEALTKATDTKKLSKEKLTELCTKFKGIPVSEVARYLDMPFPITLALEVST